jgi:hemerythrin-like domain-containing protein
MDPRSSTGRLVLPTAQRRGFLVAAGVGAATLVAAACGGAARGAEHGEKEEEEGAEVTPGEDLMQEHGLLERVLLIYEAAIDRAEKNDALEPGVIVDAAGIIRAFVEDYHEKQEEDFVFPRLAKTDQAALVATLLDQHKKGRAATDEILGIARAQTFDKAALAPKLRAFIRMYRPHAAREETVLLPAFRRTLDNDGYKELGEKFEEREHQMFGGDGFEDMVKKVAGIEQVMGIDDLAKMTV